jgi:hypothetical protein
METKQGAPDLIEKEEIPSITFSRQEVLTDPVLKAARKRNAVKATILGNGYHGKVCISFLTADQEVKRVSTSIWEVDDEHITLKSGVTIPMRAIQSIEV